MYNGTPLNYKIDQVLEAEVDCVVGAVELNSNELYVGSAIPVKRDEEGWAFIVVHCLEKSLTDFEVRQEVTLVVDKPYQQALSRGHSAGAYRLFSAQQSVGGKRLLA